MISFEEKAPTQLQEIRIPILSLLMAIIKAKLVMIKRQKIVKQNMMMIICLQRLITKFQSKRDLLLRQKPTICTNDYLQPTLRNFNADLFIIHIGRNDASLNKRNKEIVQNFVKLAASIVTNIKNVAVSNIDPREYNYKMKVEQINKIIDEVWKKTYSFDQK